MSAQNNPDSSPSDMTRESSASSPALSRRNELNNLTNGHEFQHQILQLKKEYHIQEQILLQHFHAEQQQLANQHQQELQQHLKLKKQQQIQQQILLQHFQAQQQQLAEQHEQQLRHHLKELWEQQKALEEQQREQREKERLELLMKKEKHEQSAVASSEVKQKLQGFLLNKKHREAAAAANGAVPSPNIAFRNWSLLQGGMGESGASAPNTASPYHPRINPLLAKYEDDFPLRKTASEPNLLKVRLKQRVIERRASPIARRRDRPVKRKSQLAIESTGSNPDSGPSSPPVSQLSPPTGHNTPIQEEDEQYGQLSTSPGSMSDLSGLYTSPSMPNISLGRPATSTSSENKLAPVSEAEVRAAFAARLGLPLTGQMLPGTLPFYPTLPVIEAEFGSATYAHKQAAALEQGRPCMPPSMYHSGVGVPITDTQVAHARLNKQGHRPLGRTQSAPLPLGHPMLAPGPTNLATTNHQITTHNLLRQQIRQTVLTRAGSRAQSLSGTQLDETPETEHLPEVIDLTEKEKRNEGDVESEMCRQKRERESFLQQQRDLMMRHTLQVSEGSAFSPRTSHVVRPLSRALSSPLVALSPESAPSSNPSTSPVAAVTTGLAYDGLMLKHACVCGDNGVHLEHGGRLQSVWARLGETALVQRCERVRGRKATLDELQLCHSEAHTLLFGTNPLSRQRLEMSKLSQLPIKSFVRLPCGGVGVDSDTTWNELHTGPAARMAAGCVIDLAYKTATGEVNNGMAVVRPPGHHAETSQAMGFCFFNSVAIATRLLQQRLDLRRILIVDWDVHHGNGTQQVFYDDPRVLYLSIHRHDDGNFFPGTGGPTECGRGAGLGFNVNIAWSGGLNPPMADAEYLAAFRTIVMPIAKEFDPELVMVSAGFDAAAGHLPPLGGYKLSPACFGYMTQQLMQLANGKVVLSLEGGYDLPAICDSAEECVRALLGDEPRPLSQDELRRTPNQNAIDTLQKTIAVQLSHWQILQQTAQLVACSALDASLGERDETETVSAMASLSMQQQASSQLQSPERSREVSVEPMEEDEVK